MYDAEVSPTLISKVTNEVMEQVVEWQYRPLGSIYPIVVKIKQDKRVINNAIYLALGAEGYKELLGIWGNSNKHLACISGYEVPLELAFLSSASTSAGIVLFIMVSTTPFINGLLLCSCSNFLRTRSE